MNVGTPAKGGTLLPTRPAENGSGDRGAPEDGSPRRRPAGVSGLSRFSFYSGLALLTFSTLMLEVVETRLLSVIAWYHLAFFIISAAMFGMTAGAIWVYRRRERHTPETLARDLVMLGCGFALSTAVSLVLQTTLATAQVITFSFVLVYVELALAVAAPFFFSGAAVSLALTRSPFPIGQVYAADLAGAAVGCLGVLVVLGPLNASSAILLAGAGGAAAAWLFARSGAARGSARPHPIARPALLFLVLAAAALINGRTNRGIQPIVVKDEVEFKRGKVLFERWNSFSRVQAYAPSAGAPILWGPSSRRPEVSTRQIRMNIDGDAATIMYHFDGDVDNARFVAYDVTNLAYYLRHSGRAAVVGSGSGRDVLSAWVFGFRDVTGVELNPTFVEMLTRREPFREFAGLSKLPGVRFVAAEARSWMARSRDSFDLIEMSMIDTWAATGAGAFTLSENGLYTTEAWKTFLARLKPDGVFSVSRWYAPSEVNETGRMVNLGAAALLASGVKNPGRHLFLACSGRIATLLIAKEALRPEEIATLRNVCRDLDYGVILSPDSASVSPLLDRIASAESPAAQRAAIAGLPLDLSAPTDDRPFFFNLLPLTRPHLAWRYLQAPGGVIRGNITATLTLLTILVVSLMLVAVTIVLPLRPAIRHAGRKLVLGGTAYFLLLGLGFMFVEMGLLQRCTMYLGHPVYSLSIVLFSLILSTGIGSWLSESAPLRSRGRLVFWSVLTAVYLGSLPWWLPALFQAQAAAGILTRCSLVAAVIAVGGLMMGYGFPTGMRLVSAVDVQPTVWFWGVNGAAGVLASVVAVALSISAGISVTLLAGAVCYLLLIPAGFTIGFGRNAAI